MVVLRFMVEHMFNEILGTEKISRMFVFNSKFVISSSVPNFDSGAHFNNSNGRKNGGN